jgi:hypothetical protein
VFVREVEGEGVEGGAHKPRDTLGGESDVAIWWGSWAVVEEEGGARSAREDQGGSGNVGWARVAVEVEEGSHVVVVSGSDLGEGVEELDSFGEPGARG